MNKKMTLQIIYIHTHGVREQVRLCASFKGHQGAQDVVPVDDAGGQDHQFPLRGRAAAVVVAKCEPQRRDFRVRDSSQVAHDRRGHRLQ
jgi:hypothetical protein